MKKFITISLAVLAILSLSNLANAQERSRGHRGGGEGRDRRPDPEVMAQKVAEQMAKDLELDQETAPQFIELYKAYRLENMKINRAHHNRLDPDTATESDIDAKIRDGFAMSRELLDLREKYYEKFLELLSPRQAMKMYYLERNQQRGGFQGGPRSGGFQGGRPEGFGGQEQRTFEEN